jgi:transcriptional regulator with XRE-family HTH domain
MGGKIPRPIRVQAIKAWLEGKSRDKIAEEIGISTGAVSSIIKDFRRDDPHFDLLRETAVKIKNLNMDIQSFAPLVRVYEVLREKELLTGIIGQESLELMQDRMEALIVALEVFCFKKEQLSIEDFVSLITNMYNTADKLDVPLDRLPAHITELGDRIDALRGELDQLEAKKQDALRDNEATAELLQEYNANKPFIQQIQMLKQQLADKDEEIRKGKEELENERFWKAFEEKHTWSTSGDELDKASIGLGLSPLYNIDGNPSLRVRDLKDWVMDVFYHPGMYVDALRQIRDIYNSQYKLTTASKLENDTYYS